MIVIIDFGSNVEITGSFAMSHFIKWWGERWIVAVSRKNGKTKGNSKER